MKSIRLTLLIISLALSLVCAAVPTFEHMAETVEQMQQAQYYQGPGGQWEQQPQQWQPPKGGWGGPPQQ